MISFVLGGARSGKSALAELQAARWAEADGRGMTYVATGEATDGDMAIRIDQHRRRRPAKWDTVEIETGGDMAKAVVSLTGTVLIDSMSTWIAGFEGFATDVARLATAIRLRKGDTVVVSDEVGLGVHPSFEVGRVFRDALGDVNQAIAAVATEVWLVIAGIPMRVDSGGARR